MTKRWTVAVGAILGVALLAGTGAAVVAAREQGPRGPGGERRLEGVRFILVDPGREMNAPTAQMKATAPVKSTNSGGGNPYAKYIAIMLSLAAVAVIVLLIIKK